MLFGDVGDALGDIFQLQDDLSGASSRSLKVPLTARDHRALGRDVPASPEAYELYLRANKLAIEAQHWTIARDLYLQCGRAGPRAMRRPGRGSAASTACSRSSASCRIRTTSGTVPRRRSGERSI